MNISINTGNIFDSKLDYLVNPINCIGVSSRGLALDFAVRYPEMENKYIQYCNENKIQIGTLWIYKNIINFPTKLHWKNPSKLEYLEQGLNSFIKNYQKYNITEIAFPLLGAGLGELNKDEVLNLMKNKLNVENLKVEIWIYKYKECSFFMEFMSFLMKNEKSFLSLLNNSILVEIKNKFELGELKTVNDFYKIKNMNGKLIRKLFILYNVKDLDQL